MLACLVAIPLAAVFGKSLPDLFKSLFGGRPAAESFQTADSWGEAPPFELLAMKEDASATTPRPLRPDGRAEPLASAATGLSSPTPYPAMGVIPAGYETPMPSSPTQGTVNVGVGVVPDYGQPTYGPPSYGRPGSASAPPENYYPVQPRTESVQTAVARIEQRLRELGATRMEYYWDGPQFYRFGCDASVGGDPTYVRHFQATNFDRIRAMGDVLQQIEVWRGGGS